MIPRLDGADVGDVAHFDNNRPALSEVGLGHVLRDHPLGIEERAVQGDRVPHYFCKAVAVTIVERKHHSFELVVERVRIVRGAITLFVMLDGPAAHAFNASFDPPAIQNTKAGHAVNGCFHPACSRRFHRRLWRIQPNVYPGGDQLA